MSEASPNFVSSNLAIVDMPLEESFGVETINDLPVAFWDCLIGLILDCDRLLGEMEMLGLSEERGEMWMIGFSQMRHLPGSPSAGMHSCVELLSKSI